MEDRIPYVDRLRKEIIEAARRNNAQTRSHPANRYRLALVAASLAVAALVSVAVLNSAGLLDVGRKTTSSSAERKDQPRSTVESPTVAGEARPVTQLFGANEPLFLTGSQTTIEDATRRVGHPLYRPATIAEDPEVWLTEDQSEEGPVYRAGLRYPDRLVVFYSRWPSGRDAFDSYEQAAEQWRAGYTTRIEGRPAWVIPEGSQAPGQPPVSVVYVTIVDVEVTLLGKMSVQNLVRHAETLRA